MASDQSIPNKDYLYGKYAEREARQFKFAEKMAYKSTDTPMDDMNVSVKNGIGFKELLALGVLGLGLTGLGISSLAGLALYLKNPPPVINAPTPTPTSTTPNNSAGPVTVEGDTITNPAVKMRFANPRNP
jgi:hypothetical protein